VKVAVPVTDGVLSGHFGHCVEFALFEVDAARGSILGRQDVPAPEHQPGLLPGWLSSHGADVVIAGSMGGRARDLFARHQVAVVAGAPEGDPRELVMAFLAGTLSGNDVPCSGQGHGEHGHDCHH